LTKAGNYDLVFESDLNDSYFSEIKDKDKHNDFTFNKISPDSLGVQFFIDNSGNPHTAANGNIEKFNGEKFNEGEFTSGYYVYSTRSECWYYLNFDNPSNTPDAFSYVGEKYKSKFGLYHLKMEKVNSEESPATPWEPHPTTTIE
jgi:hypothetical protein